MIAHWNEQRQAWLEREHVMAIETNASALSDWSRALCSCGWQSNGMVYRSYARRAWRRHLERAT